MQSLRILALGNQAVHRLCAPDLDVGSSRIEVGVGGDDFSLFGEQAEEDALGGSSPRMIPAHWESLMAEVPLSVSRSMITFSASSRNRLYPAC